MAAITAKMVADLRAKTDAPMMECKKALIEADGDMTKAEELLRVKLGTKAGKAASRITAEGVVAAFIGNGVDRARTLHQRIRATPTHCGAAIRRPVRIGHGRTALAGRHPGRARHHSRYCPQNR